MALLARQRSIEGRFVMHWRSMELVIALAVGAWSIPAPADEPAPATINPAVAARADEPAKTLRVAAVQMRSSRDLAENVAKVKQHLADCAAPGPGSSCFPSARYPATLTPRR